MDPEQARLARLRASLYRSAEALGVYRLWVTLQAARGELKERLFADPGSLPCVVQNLDGVAPSAADICFFASYSRDGVLAPYVRRYLVALREQLDCDIVFVSTTALGEPDVEWLRTVCLKVVLRENRGYDFGSWRIGLALGPDRSRYRNLFIANDSVYGPMFGMRQVLDLLASPQPTVVGITESLAVASHLQSYFVGFNRAAFTHPFFERFWQRVLFFADKRVIIHKYELGLSIAAARAGCRVVALFPFRQVRDIAERNFRIPALHRGRAYVNPSHVFWECLFGLKCPMLKVDLLRTNPWKADLSGLRRCLADAGYPAELIQPPLPCARG
jgi:lipopolysaccharide biosynthesis protein